MGLAGGLATNGGIFPSVGELPASVVSASSPADTPAVTVGGSQLVNVPAWKATTLYPAGFVVQQNGLLYAANATFTSAGSFNAANWTALTAAGTELAYAETTSTQGSISTITDLTGLTVPAFVGPSRPVLVLAYIPFAQNTNTRTVTLTLRNSDNTAIGAGVIAYKSAAAGLFDYMILRRRLTLVAGTTYNWKLSLATAGDTVGTQCAATDPCSVQVLTT